MSQDDNIDNTTFIKYTSTIELSILKQVLQKNIVVRLLSFKRLSVTSERAKMFHLKHIDVLE